MSPQTRWLEPSFSLSFPILFHRGWFGRSFDSFWFPFGSISITFGSLMVFYLVPKGVSLEVPWFTLAPFWIYFGRLWRPFGFTLHHFGIRIHHCRRLGAPTTIQFLGNVSVERPQTQLPRPSHTTFHLSPVRTSGNFWMTLTMDSHFLIFPVVLGRVCFWRFYASFRRPFGSIWIAFGTLTFSFA